MAAALRCRLELPGRPRAVTASGRTEPTTDSRSWRLQPVDYGTRWPLIVRASGNVRSVHSGELSLNPVVFVFLQMGDAIEAGRVRLQLVHISDILDIRVKSII